MKQEIIKIKVLTGAPELEGMKLSLVKIDEGLYVCINSKIEIIDAWEELDSIEEYSKKSEDNIFFDMQIFSTSFGKELKFIEEVEFLGTKTIQIKDEIHFAVAKLRISSLRTTIKFIEDEIIRLSESSIRDEVPRPEDKIKPYTGNAPF